MLLEGAVRSSKTWTADMVFLDKVRKLPPCNVLLSGKSITTVARNVLSSWKRMIGESKFSQVRSTGDEYLHIDYPGLDDKQFYIRGAFKSTDESTIRGSTFGAWYADELTLHHYEFYKMGMTRLSLPYSFSIATTNPDTPKHWVYRYIIAGENDGDKDYTRDYQIWKFVLNDNPSLSADYRAEMANLYQGVFKRRFIYGEWCIAEGVIYDMFNAAKHVTDQWFHVDSHCVGVDYGSSNATVFLLCGMNKYPNPFFNIEKEYFYSGRDRQKSKAPSEYVDDFIDFVGNETINKVFIDPSASPFISELKNRTNGFSIIDKDDVEKAINDILPGIELVKNFLHNEYLVVHPSCTNTINEFQTYSWDEKNEITGEEKIKKVNDHCMDALRYPIYSTWCDDDAVINFYKLLNRRN